jgi:hypothetical protein
LPLISELPIYIRPTPINQSINWTRTDHSAWLTLEPL